MLIGKLLVAGFAQAAASDQSPLTIVAFGDSLTQGYGLIEQDGFVPQLRNWLEEQGKADIRVVNAGVSGDTTSGGLSRIGWTLTPDVDAIVVALGGNDVLRGIDPALTRANIDGILTEVNQAGIAVLLIGMESPGNYGPDYEQSFEAIWPDMAEKHDTLLAPSFFEGLGAGRDMANLQRYFQNDGIHPNPEGVKKIVEGLGPYVLKLINRAENR